MYQLQYTIHTHFGTHHRTSHLEKMYLVVSVQRKVYCLTEEGHVRPKIFNNQPFREFTLDELEKREGAGTLFVQPIITRCSSTSCWPEKNTFFNSFALISLNYNPYRNHNFAKIPLPKS